MRSPAAEGRARLLPRVDPMHGHCHRRLMRLPIVTLEMSVTSGDAQSIGGLPVNRELVGVLSRGPPGTRSGHVRPPIEKDPRLRAEEVGGGILRAGQAELVEPAGPAACSSGGTTWRKDA